MRVLQRVGRDINRDMVAAQSWASAPHSGSQAKTLSAAAANGLNASAAADSNSLRMFFMSFLRESILMRAMGAETHLVLHEPLIVGDVLARFVRANCKRMRLNSLGL